MLIVPADLVFSRRGYNFSYFIVARCSMVAFYAESVEFMHSMKQIR